MSGRVGTVLAAGLLAMMTLACGGGSAEPAPPPAPVPLPVPTPEADAEAARTRAEAAMVAGDFDALWTVMTPETCYGEGCAWKGKKALQRWKKSPEDLQFAKDAIHSCSLDEDTYRCANMDAGARAEFARTPDGFKLALVDLMH